MVINLVHVKIIYKKHPAFATLRPVDIKSISAFNKIETRFN